MKNCRLYEWQNRNAQEDADTNKYANNDVASSEQMGLLQIRLNFAISFPKRIEPVDSVFKFNL